MLSENLSKTEAQQKRALKPKDFSENIRVSDMTVRSLTASIISPWCHITDAQVAAGSRREKWPDSSHKSESTPRLHQVKPHFLCDFIISCPAELTRLATTEIILVKFSPSKQIRKRSGAVVFTFVFLLPYPPGHGSVGPLFELRVRWEAIPHDIGRVVLVPQLRTALKQEVYDEELYASIQACEESTDVETRKEWKSFSEKLTFTSQGLPTLSLLLFSNWIPQSTCSVWWNVFFKVLLRLLHLIDRALCLDQTTKYFLVTTVTVSDIAIAVAPILAEWETGDTPNTSLTNHRSKTWASL